MHKIKGMPNKVIVEEKITTEATFSVNPNEIQCKVKETEKQSSDSLLFLVLFRLKNSQKMTQRMCAKQQHD